MSSTFCYVCYSTELTVRDGVLVCDACGTQAQGAIEEQEFQQGVDDARGKKTIRATTAQATIAATANVERQELAAKENLRAAAMTYCRALQRLLQMQAAALVSAHGANPQLESVMRQVWLAWLPRTGILEPDYYVRRPQANAADGEPPDASPPPSSQRGGAGGAEDGGVAAAAAAAAKPMRLRAALWRLLSPQVTLRISFLACHILREAVTPGDIIAWAANGQLPYFQLPAIANAACVLSAPATAAAQAPPLPLLCVTPQLWDTPTRLAVHTGAMARALGLGVPPVNGEVLLQRAAVELGLPLCVHRCAEQLLRLHVAGTRALSLPQGELRVPQHDDVAIQAGQPYTAVAATLLVALKLTYGLGARSGGGGGGDAGSAEASGAAAALPGAPPPPGPWAEWAAGAIRRLAHARREPPRAQAEAFGLEGLEADEYLRYCLEVIFAQHGRVGGGGGGGGGDDGGLSEFRQLFLGMWEEAAGERRQQQQEQWQQQLQQQEEEGDQEQWRPWQQQQQQQQEEQDEAAAMDVDGDESGKGAGLPHRPMAEAPAAGTRVKPGARGRRRGPSKPAAAPATEEPEPAATRGYRLADGVGRSASPDYAALLAACAAWARCAPLALHRRVVDVEGRLVDAESAVQLRRALAGGAGADGGGGAAADGRTCRGREVAS